MHAEGAPLTSPGHDANAALLRVHDWDAVDLQVGGWVAQGIEKMARWSHSTVCCVHIAGWDAQEGQAGGLLALCFSITQAAAVTVSEGASASGGWDITSCQQGGRAHAGWDR